MLLLGGKPTEAAGALRQALACFERKGNLVSAERARERLQESSRRVASRGCFLATSSTLLQPILPHRGKGLTAPVLEMG